MRGGELKYSEKVFQRLDIWLFSYSRIPHITQVHPGLGWNKSPAYSPLSHWFAVKKLSCMNFVMLGTKTEQGNLSSLFSHFCRAQAAQSTFPLNLLSLSCNTALMQAQRPGKEKRELEGLDVTPQYFPWKVWKRPWRLSSNACPLTQCGSIWKCPYD